METKCSLRRRPARSEAERVGHGLIGRVSIPPSEKGELMEHRRATLMVRIGQGWLQLTSPRREQAVASNT
jgi:hypothetical protein